MTSGTDSISLPADQNHLTVEPRRLSVADQHALAQAILNPPPPSPALIRAAEACRRLIRAA